MKTLTFSEELIHTLTDIFHTTKKILTVATFKKLHLALTRPGLSPWLLTMKKPQNYFKWLIP